MDTEQAHSQSTGTIGRNPVPPRPDPRTAERAGPAIWLNLVCLDAPLVAVAWLCLFARTFQIRLHAGNAVALFLTAWLIYLADRWADSISLKPGAPRSLRQEFCLRHREIWITTVLLVGGFDVYVIWQTTALATFLIGGVVGGLAVIYLVVNHPLGLVWRSLPAKELAIGVLFAAGTMVALMPAVPVRSLTFATSVMAFAALCALNCISIAAWERDLDRAQQKVSIATRHPNFTRRTGVICGGFAIACFALIVAARSAAPLLACIGVSALLLSWLNASLRLKEGRFQNRRSFRLDCDQRTALADLVLLTPIILLIAGAR